MKQRYAKFKGLDVYLMDKATKIERKNNEINKNQVIIQSLKTGTTAVINKKLLKDITYKFPRKIR